MKQLSILALALFCLARGWGQVALTPSTPAISPAPVFVSGSPALTVGTPNPGSVVTNATLLTLSESLQSLQTNLEQALPVLALFNDNFDFVSLGDNGLASSRASSPPGNFSANLATNFAANFGVNAAVPTGRSLFNANPNARTVPPAASGLPQGAATLPITRDTLRALLVLQSDMQRMLPILTVLNNGTTNSPGSFTNLFGLVPTSQ